MESISSPKVSQGKQNNPRIEGLPAPLSGCRNGRPPDTNALVVVPSSLERSANPIYDEDQQVMKRSRGDGQETMDVEVDVQEDGSDVVMQITAKDGLSCEEEGTVRNDDIPRVEGTPPGMNKPSFRDMLTGRGSTAGSSPALSELDVEILAEDVCVSSVDGMPSITFSDRVHNMVDAKLTNAVVVRLLGRNIGYGALLTRIRSLWTPSNDIALIDLDNGYFLVRFASAADVTKVLMGGPWLIYGNYLTVQPWSRNFSTNADHPDKIVVWARLPGLPYRYYTKSMFRCIAGAIGEVVKIDYNTSEGKRGRFARLAVVVDLNKPLIPSLIVDGFCQRIESEGLPTICYACGRYGHTQDVCKPHAEKVNSNNQPTSGKSKSREVEERFGPWMQVPTRKSGRVMQGRGSSTVINSRKDFVEHQSGKFAVLAQEEDEHELIEVNTLGDSSLLELNHVGDVVVTAPRSMVKEPITGYASKEIMNAENCKEMSSDGRILLHGSGSESAVRGLNVKEGDRNVAVAPNELVVHSKTKLNTGNHTVVKILERQSGTISKSSSTSRSNVGGESAATKGGQGLLIGKNGIRKKQPVRKKQDARAPSKVTLGEWIGDLSRDIAVSGSRGNRHRDNVPVANDGPDTAVQWRANTTFEQGSGQ
ncbi:hypothetical protein GQ457_11G016650 [Hibiscus cannabinus]